VRREERKFPSFGGLGEVDFSRADDFKRFLTDGCKSVKVMNRKDGRIRGLA